MILVTNYQKKIFGEPIEKILKGKRIVFDEKLMEISINECVFCGVFETVPFMRNIPDNKGWFEENIYHLS